MQETARVWVAVAEQVFEEADQLPAVQAYVQVEVSLKVCVSAPSVPQVKGAGVQLCVSAGAAVVQLLLETVVPSLRVQVAVCDAVPEFAATTQVPVRVWVKPVPQPVAGAHEVYCHEAVPPLHDPNPEGVHAKVQVE